MNEINATFSKECNEIMARDDHIKQPPNDFRIINIRPTSTEIFDAKKPFLRSNIVRGMYPEGVCQYLDIHFCLLRDFVRPLRNLVRAYINDGMDQRDGGGNETGGQQKERSDILVLRNVTINNEYRQANREFFFKAKFDVTSLPRTINWKVKIFLKLNFLDNKTTERLFISTAK